MPPHAMRLCGCGSPIGSHGSRQSEGRSPTTFGRRLPTSRVPTSRQSRPAGSRRTVILDSDGVVKYLRGDPRVSAMLESEILQAGSRLVVPSVTLVEASRAGVDREHLVELVREVHELAPVDVPRAQQAAALQDYAVREIGRDVGVVDALVVTEALLRVPPIIITSDPADMRLLCDSDPSTAGRAVVWRI